MPDDKKKRYNQLMSARKEHLAGSKKFKTEKEASDFAKKTKSYDNAIIKESQKIGLKNTPTHSKSLGTKSAQAVDKNSIAVKNSTIDRLTKMNNANWSESKTGMPGAHKKK